jgi:hypothetical protein
MGALISKPTASSFRTWDLIAYKTVDYQTLTLPEITVYTFANKAVRILPVSGWISDKTRFSFDGWTRQRLTSCFMNGVKVSWFKTFAYLIKNFVNRQVSLHWSSLDPNSILPVLKILNFLGSVSLPYTNVLGNRSNTIKNLSTSTSFRWSVNENFPTLSFLNSKSFCYKEYSTETITKTFRIQPIVTSSEETENSYLPGSFTCNFSRTCLVQTELLTSNKFIYFGTHGYINAQRCSLIIPTLLPYERYSDLTGRSFIKGPINSRSLASFSVSLMQLMTLFNRRSQQFFIKKTFDFEFIEKKLLLTTSKNNFRFVRQAPELASSPIVQMLVDFVQYE